MTRLRWAPLLLAACLTNRETAAPPPDTNTVTEDKPAAAPVQDQMAGGSGVRGAIDDGKMGKKDSAPSKTMAFASEVAAEPEKPMPVAKAPADGDEQEESGGESAPTRAWFPETFLFEPLVVTDERGAATVPVKVPDRLTSWRVLALAHARNGAQAGTTHSFLGTLPAYVELVVPPQLVTGDELRLPVQVVNTTEKAITAPLRVDVDGGALVGYAPRTVTVPALGSLVENLTLIAGKPGVLKVRAQLGSTDAVLRTVDVVPYGKPASITRAGSLAAPRTLGITGDPAADPTTSRVKVRIYAGALSLLRAELSVTGNRGGVAEDAYTLLLAGRAPALLTALGDKADSEALRQLSLLGAQRAVRHARALDVTRATLLTEAALAHPDNAILTRIGERAAAWLAEHQRPDGTFSGETGWTLQRLLVTTADGVRAVRSAADTSDTARRRATRVSLAAQGAFERNAGRIDDPYTAAAILASGAAPPSLRPKLLKLLRDSFQTGPDGQRTLQIPSHVVRPDGQHPSLSEASALAALALLESAEQDEELLADLGATLLGGYEPSWGWGDGRTNLVALQAVVKLFRDPIPPDVVITVSLDGKEVASGKLSAERIKDVLTLVADVPGAPGAHEWQIVATPPVAGLGYSLTLEQWLPWDQAEMEGGLELSLSLPENMTVGKPAAVMIRLAAPGNIPIDIVQALPAGVQPDTASLQKLVDDGSLTSFDTADGSITLHLSPIAPGSVFTSEITVVPTLAGKLRATATTLTAGGQTYYAAPPLWVVR